MGQSITPPGCFGGNKEGRTIV